MKHKILSFLTALAMVLTVLVQPFQTAKAEGDVTNTVTLHKILMSKDALDKHDANKEYDGTQINDISNFFSADAKEIANVYFAVKNADGSKYVKEDGTETDNVDEALGGLTTATGLVLNTANLKGDYTIVEVSEKTTYKGDDDELLAANKAVPVKITLPLVNDKGVVTDAHVYPKNTQEKPEIDKNFAKNHGLKVGTDNKSNNDAGADYNNYQEEKATVEAELGKVVPYEVKTKVKAGSRYQRLRWSDTMSNGLTFNTDSLKISSEQLTGDNALAESDYTIQADDRGFTLTLEKSGRDKVNAITHPESGEGQDVEFTLTYSATVNSNAVHDIPEKNDIKLEYSNKPKDEHEPTPVTPDNGELKVTKTWSDTNGEHPEVVYTITNNKEGQENITAAVMLDSSKTSGTIDLGNGITFEITGAYEGTFKGLTGDGWTISERVAGYDPSVIGTTVGTAAITNTKDEENPTPLNPTEPKVVNYGKRFVKADQTTGERLQGAEFVVKNAEGKYLALKDLSTTEGEGKTLADAKTAYENALSAWNKAVEDNPNTADEEIQVVIGEETITGKSAAQAKINELYNAYKTAYEKAANAYEWVGSSDAANVVKLISDNQGKFEITGLEAGTYNLVETKEPAGYATIKDVEFTVGAGTYDSTPGGVTYESNEKVVDGQGEQALRVNNKKVSIPQTGGIGSLIFVVAGIAIMGHAAYKIKSNKQEA